MFPERDLVFPWTFRYDEVDRNIKKFMFPPRYSVFPHMLTWSYTYGYICLFSFNWNLTETCKKVVRFRCDRSNGNTSKRHQTESGNACWASCFRNVFTYFFHVSVYGFLIFRPVYIIRIYFSGSEISTCLINNKTYNTKEINFEQRKASTQLRVVIGE